MQENLINRRELMLRIYSYGKGFLFYVTFSAYIFVFTKLLLFKEVTLFGLFSTDRIITRTINIVPFQTIYEYIFSTHFNLWIFLMEVIGNVVLFLPLGIYLQIFKRNKNILNCVIQISIISISIEIAQYILGIGHADIDDIILNTIGGLLGIIIYRIIYLILKKEDKVRTAIAFLWVIFGVFCLTFLKLSGLIIRI